MNSRKHIAKLKKMCLLLNHCWFRISASYEELLALFQPDDRRDNWLFASKTTMAAPHVVTKVAMESMFHWKMDATEDLNVLALFPTGFGKSLTYQLALLVVSRFHCWSDWLKLACRQMVRLITGQVVSASACPFPQSTRVKKSHNNRSSKCWVVR